MKKISTLILLMLLSSNMFAMNSKTDDTDDSGKKPVIEKARKNSLITYNKSKMLNYFAPTVKLKNHKLSKVNSAFPSLCYYTVGNAIYDIYELGGEWYVSVSSSTVAGVGLTETTNEIEAHEFCAFLEKME